MAKATTAAAASFSCSKETLRREPVANFPVAHLIVIL